MGTRSLIMVQSNNKLKVAQYCQYDGYLLGQGQKVLESVIDLADNPGKLEYFRQIVDGCTYADEAYFKSCIESVGIPKDTEYMDQQQASVFLANFPEFDRALGAGIIPMLLKRGSLKLKNDEDFAGDSVFCEYAYVVNLDDKLLEVYEGSNEEPLEPSDRFYHLTGSEKKDCHPIKIVAQYVFDELTKDTFRELNEVLSDDEDE